MTIVRASFDAQIQAAADSAAGLATKTNLELGMLVTEVVSAGLTAPNLITEVNSRLAASNIPDNDRYLLAGMADALQPNASSSGGQVLRVDTVGAHTFTVPDGVYLLRVSGCGAGGGGAGSVGSNANPGNFSGGGGGGGASCTRLPFFVNPGEVLSLNVGTGGVGGVGGSNANRGDHGGSSSVTGQLDNILLPGGERGESSVTVPKGGKFAVDGSAHLVSGGNGGTGAKFSLVPVGAEGTYRYAGGATGSLYVYVYQGGGGGGASYFGGGGSGGNDSTDKNGQPGGVGAGGGGAHRGAIGQNFNGAAGGNGLIVLEY